MKISSILYGFYKQNKRTLLFSLILTFFMLTSIGVYKSHFKFYYQPIRQSVVNPELTITNVKREIINQSLKYPDIVLRQVILESGWLKSQLVKTNNNLLGMKHPKKRKTHSQGEKHGYASFLTWTDCIKDYKLLQSRFKGKTKIEYVSWLCSKYAEDSLYQNKLENIHIYN